MNPVSVHVFLEERFIRTADGKTWTTNGFGDAFWKPYLEVFDEVVIVARVGPGTPSPLAEVVTFDRVRMVDLPYFHGPRAFARVALPVWNTIREATRGSRAC